MAAASELQENSDKKTSSDETEVRTTETKKMKLEDLKVTDLKNELEKRNLDKNGVKSTLIERLKSAMLEDGEDPNEYIFEISPEKSLIKKKKDSASTNGIIECANEGTNDEINNHEEKQEIALQLSIDEEEAQLNEEESLIEITKSTNENKDTGEGLDCEVTVSEKCDEATDDKQTTPVKVTKLVSEDTKEKKITKTPVQNKSSDVSSAVSPKVIKVIGKNEKLKSVNVLAKSLWVTGLSNTTRAAELKTLFGKQGRVLSVKIVKKQTSGKCYGFISMATGKDASKAIQNLHRTELNGRIISVERTQNEPSSLLKKSESKMLTLTAKKQSLKKEVASSKQAAHQANASAPLENKDAKVTDSKKPSSEESAKKRDEKVSSAEKSKSKDKLREHRGRGARRPIRKPADFRPRSFGFNDRPRYGGFRRPFGRRPFTSRIGFGSDYRSRSNIIAVQKLREERFQREKFRERREAERRADELSRHRYIERKQREEAYRLEREKERLRIERELLERERAEILKLEREKQRFERERLEREREELRRQAELRRSSKRPFSRIEREAEPLWDERKKSAPRYDGRSSFHGDIPSSSRFEFPSRERIGFNREFERHPERYNTPKHIDTLSRSDFGDRDARREVTIRSRDERQVFRSDMRERDQRRSFSSREHERHSSRREAGRDDWKHDRRVHERIVSSNASSAPRRMTYY